MALLPGGEDGRAGLAVGILGVTLLWTVLAGGALLGVPVAVVFATGCAGALLLGPRFVRVDAIRAGLATLAGIASFGATILLLEAACRLVGVATDDLAFAAPPAADAIAVVAFAPVFEEIVYRGPLLASRRTPTGGLCAAILTSAAYALPHAVPPLIVGCFVLGLGLATLRLHGLPLAAAIGLHAGLNLAGLATTWWPGLLASVTHPGVALAGLAAALSLLTRSRLRPGL